MATAIATSGFNPAQLRLIRDTVAKDTNETEFDLFLEACKAYRLDPFRRQINVIVYNKNKPDKRKMAIIPSRDGLRIMAQRCRDYRPASEPALIDYDASMIGPTNPKGIIAATVRLWKQDNKGEWYPVAGQAYWDEFVPVTDEWIDDEETRKRRPTGKKILDPLSNWAKMPIIMITKCAEGQALRAGWPDEFGGVYAEEEMDRMTADISASEAIAQFEQQERAAKVGGPGVMLVFDATSMVMEKVALGQVADRCLEFIEAAEPAEAHAFRIRNTASLQEFWAHSKAEALVIKKALEAKEQQMLEDRREEA